MKDRHPLKRVSLVFLTITLLGLTSSWLSSCTESTAATGDHGDITNRLVRIEAKIGDPGTNQNGNVQTMATLASKLSDDIGLMSQQIGLMADRIVETEYLIVQVITNQTATAATAINRTTLADGTTPMLDKSNMPAGTKTADLLVLNQILKGHTNSNGVMLSSIGTPPTTTIAPTMTFNGSNTNYVLLVSSAAIFNPASTSTQQTINPAAAIGTNTNLTTAWQNMLTGLNLTTGNTVYIAVKVSAGGNLSSMSNVLSFTL